MIRGILVFLCVFMLLHGAWKMWKAATWKERLTVVLNMLYSLLLGALTMTVIYGIVFLF